MDGLSGDVQMSDKLTIRTNNVPRYILYWWELTEKEQEEFDYRLQQAYGDSDQIDAKFVRYKGVTYDLSDFMRWDVSISPRWDGYHGDSYFSGVLARFVEDDKVVMATYFS
jgi:hypothetical protein